MNNITEAKKALKIAQDNLAFARLSPAQKRVAIAHDVIAQIRAKKIIPMTGVYVEDVEQANGKIESCTACALGSVFIAASCKLPSVKNSDVFGDVVHDNGGGDEEEMRETLTPFFSEEQLLLIEAAFEQNTAAWDYETGEEVGYYGLNVDDLDPDDEDDQLRLAKVKKYSKHPAWKAAAKYGHIEDDSKRLLAIMENVIANNGTFRP